MQRFVVALSLRFKILRQVIVGIAKTIRVREVDLLCANLVPQRLEHTEFIVDAIDVLRLVLRVLFHDGRSSKPHAYYSCADTPSFGSYKK